MSRFDVDATIERLRAEACDEYRHWNYVEAVTLEQAEAAVRSAVKQDRERTIRVLQDRAEWARREGLHPWNTLEEAWADS